MSDAAQPGCLKPRADGSATIAMELRNFILGGNFIRLATAFVLALALEQLIKQFVASFITPVIGIIGGNSFQDLAFSINKSKFAYGLFLDAIISFLMIVLVIFFCLILPLQRYGGKCAPAWVQTFCEFCCQPIPAIATKCPFWYVVGASSPVPSWLSPLLLAFLRTLTFPRFDSCL